LVFLRQIGGFFLPLDKKYIADDGFPTWRKLFLSFTAASVVACFLSLLFLFLVLSPWGTLFNGMESPLIFSFSSFPLFFEPGAGE